MALTIKPAYVTFQIAFRNSAIPLGQRSQEDLKYLLLLAYFSNRNDYVNLFVSPPTLDELLGNAPGGGGYQNPQDLDAREFGVSAAKADNASAIMAGLNAALAIGGRLVLPPGILRFSNIELPYNSPISGSTLGIVELVGASHPAQFFGTVGSYPMPSRGTVLKCMANSGAAMNFSNDNTDFGGISLLHLIAKNLTIRLMEPGVHGLLAGKASQLTVKNLQIDTGIFSAACLEPINDSTGLETPIINNGALSLIDNFSASGLFFGLVSNEHVESRAVNLTSNKVGMLVQPGYHSQCHNRIDAQRCQVAVAVDLDNISTAANRPYFTIQQLNLEHAGPTQTDPGTAWQNALWDVLDPHSNGRGEITWNITKGEVGQVGSSGFLQNGATNMRVRRMGTAFPA